MKRTIIAAALAATAGTVVLAPNAIAATGHGAGNRMLPTAHAPRNSAPAKAPGKASPATSYNGVCGSGYNVIDSLPISTLGTVYLTYNNSTGNNCVVTVRANPGAATYMAAAIELAGNSSSEVIDQGNYAAYAGPVYLHAPGSCIDWEGQVSSTYAGQVDSHCS